MLAAVRYLHSRKIIHRDLKLENFLFATPDADSDLKMIDFGLSKHFQYVGEEHHEAVGTPYTVAPEVIIGSHNEKCDVWSIGVITYLLLCGDTPFGGCCGEDLLEVRDRIVSGKFEFEPEDAWEHVSDVGKDFVKSLLVVDPKQRPNAKEAQRHQWIQTWSRKKKGNTLDPSVVNALVAFKELSDMQKLLSEVLSFSLLPEQITDLRDEFAKIDNGDGEITLNDLKHVLMENAEAGSLGALTEEEVEGESGWETHVATMHILSVYGSRILHIMLM
jgi:calcium-dependent protein kinase